MDRWSSCVAVVTGGGSGIGAGVAAALAAAGLRVVTLDIAHESDNVDNLAVPSEGSVVARRCDVTDPQQIEDAFSWVEKELGGVHVLVCCAGVLFPGQITEVGDSPLSAELLGRTIDVNSKAVVLCSRRAVASMKRHGIAGHIVVINSLAGHYVPAVSLMNVYAASKYAVTAFIQALNQELADFNSQIKTTSISPGRTDSPLARRMLSAMGSPPSQELSPADVAGAVLYALSTPPHVNINELTISSVREKNL